MADNGPETKNIEFVPHCVQEIAKNSKDPPESYCHKNGVSGWDTSQLSLVEVPVIDLGFLASPSPSIPELDKLHAAMSSFGAFMAVNHGMTSAFLDEVRLVGKQFFALPMEEKKKYATQVNCREGYGNDPIYTKNQVFNWADRLLLITNPEDQRKLQLWPKSPEKFMETISEYSRKLQFIRDAVLKALAMSLNLDDRCFLDKYGDQGTLRSRFNLYPPCSRPDLVLGSKPHSDSSAITILLQDIQVEGLQILKDDQWFRVPVIPEALLISIGDEMEIMSNGLFKSLIHRVVVNSERERFSLAVFCSSDPNNDIEPVDGLVNETRPRLYKKVKNYISNYFQALQQGKRLIEDMKIEPISNREESA